MTSTERLLQLVKTDCRTKFCSIQRMRNVQHMQCTFSFTLIGHGKAALGSSPPPSVSLLCQVSACAASGSPKQKMDVPLPDIDTFVHRRLFFNKLETRDKATTVLGKNTKTTEHEEETYVIGSGKDKVLLNTK